MEPVNSSIGVLIKAQRLGYPISLPEAVQRMREQGIWLSDKVVQFALAQGH